MGSIRQVLEISEIAILICFVSNKLKYKDRLFENDRELDFKVACNGHILSYE